MTWIIALLLAVVFLMAGLLVLFIVFMLFLAFVEALFVRVSCEEMMASDVRGEVA